MGKSITLTAADGFQLSAYRADPAGDPRGAVVVTQEIFGVNSHIKSVCDGFAKDGYAVIAPALFDRYERNVDIGYTAEDIARGRALKSKAATDAALQDIAAARDALAGAGKVGIVGYCWGGFITRATPDSFSTPERPTPVIDLVPNLGCPLYVVCGEEDQNPSPADAEELRKRLQNAGKTFAIDIFKNASHAFFADYRPSYREPAAFELWPKMVSFFETHLK